MVDQNARQNYYAFAHQAMPELFFSDAQKLLDTLQEYGPDFPRYIWRQLENFPGIETSGEDKEIEAIQLIDKAENLADKNEGDEAIKYYEQAAQIYLDLGSYLKLDELYVRIAR